MKNLGAIPLAEPVNGGIYLGVLIVAAVLILLGLRKRAIRGRVAVSIIAAAVLGFLTWLVLEVLWKPFPDSVPWTIYAAGSVAAAAILAVFFHRGRRILMTLTAILATAAALGVSNVQYQTYPDVASLDPTPVATQMSLQEFQQLQGAPALGAAEVKLPIPGKESGLNWRDAQAYIPPAYFEDPSLKLPVIVLLNGNPGGPEQWFGSGGARQTADMFQAANNGVSPIVIAVDATGSTSGNPICADSTQAKAMTYLAKDVPAAIKANLRVDTDQSHWGVVGLSYGGTCSLQIATNYPEAYGSYVNLSGQAEPTIGTHDDTVKQFFGGDERAFDAQDPAHLLAAAKGTAKYKGIPVVFISGEKDAHSTEALTHLEELAKAAGMDTYRTTLPGGHSFQVWRPGLREVMAWVATRGGLTVNDPFNGIGANDVRN